MRNLTSQSDQQLLHAIDMMMVCDWENAKTAIEDLDDALSGRLHMLISECERREQENHRVAALMRHEMGNALSVAMANLEGVMDGVLACDRQRLEAMHEAMGTVSSLLDRWRRAPEGSPTETIRLETFNICALIGAQYAGITALADAKDVRVAFYPCGRKYSTCTQFRGDPVAIGQILRNVLINAVRYTPPGGNVELVCDRPDGDLLVTIRDSGPGIAPEDLPHVFEEGYRGDRASVEGSGLGLTVVERLLQAFGGRARVVEEQRGGATFLIDLPAAPVG